MVPYKLIDSKEALNLLRNHITIAEESGEYLFHYDGKDVCLYHYCDKRCFLSTKTPWHRFILYEGVKYYQTDLSKYNID